MKKYKSDVVLKAFIGKRHNPNGTFTISVEALEKPKKTTLWEFGDSFNLCQDGYISVLPYRKGGKASFEFTEYGKACACLEGGRHWLKKLMKETWGFGLTIEECMGHDTEGNLIGYFITGVFRDALTIKHKGVLLEVFCDEQNTESILGCRILESDADEYNSTIELTKDWFGYLEKDTSFMEQLRLQMGEL